MKMGYAEDVYAFGEWTQGNRLNSTERLLWYRIRWFFARKGDPKRLSIKSCLLMEMENLSQATFNRARNRLESDGLIRTESVRGQETVYELLPIVKNGLKSQSFGQSFGQSDGQSGEPYACAPARDISLVPTQGNINNNIYYNSSLSLVTPVGEGVGEGGTERPDIQAVEEYIRRTGLDVDAGLFVKINNANGWKDSQGNPIRNWQIWLNGFATKFPKTRPDKIPTALNFTQREYKPGELDYLFAWMDKYDCNCDDDHPQANAEGAVRR